MITICEECGKKYRISAKMFSGTRAKFTCKNCGHLITVSRPATADEPAPKEARPPAEPETPPQAAVEKKPPAPEPPPEPEKALPKKISAATVPSPKFRFGLTAKLLTMMIVVSLVPLCMFWGISLKQTRDRIQNDAKKHINQLSINIAGHVEEWMDGNARVLKALANTEDLVSMDRRRQEPLLKVVRKVYPWVFLTTTIGIDGKSVAASDAGLEADFSKTKFFQEVIEGKPIAWQIMIEASSKKPALFLAVPIIQLDETVGVIANAIGLTSLSSLMDAWMGDGTGTAFLVDPAGRLAAHKNKHYVLERKDFSQHPLVDAYRKGQRGTMRFTDGNGESAIGHVRGAALGWTLIVEKKEKEAFYVVEQLLSYAYLLLGITVVFVFVISWFSGRALSRPIIRLTEAADRISVGDLDVDIDTRRKDEIGDLAEAIARMQDSIRLSIERLRRRR